MKSSEYERLKRNCRRERDAKLRSLDLVWEMCGEADEELRLAVAAVLS